ncbi:hypothetical protein AKJ16_DCAP16075 [Drosera capensis]
MYGGKSQRQCNASSRCAKRNPSYVLLSLVVPVKTVVYRIVSAAVLVVLTQIKPYVVHIKVSAVAFGLDMVNLTRGHGEIDHGDSSTALVHILFHALLQFSC